MATGEALWPEYCSATTDCRTMGQFLERVQSARNTEDRRFAQGLARSHKRACIHEAHRLAKRKARP